MKRMKLFTSIGALAVALCVLAFGVYAATTVTYNIKSTVTYTFSDAVVEFKSTIYGYALTDAATAANAATLATSDKESVISTLVVRSYDASNKATNPTIVAPAPADVTVDGTNINDARDFNFNAKYLYKVVIECTTPAADGVVITYTLPQTNAETTNVFIKVADSGNFASGTRLAKEAKATIVYYVGILDINSSIGSKVALTPGAMEFTNP